MPKVVGNKSRDRMGLIWILENASPERTAENRRSQERHSEQTQTACEPGGSGQHGRGYDPALGKRGGSRSEAWNDVIALQVVNALWLKDPAARHKQAGAMLVGLNGISPRDELEGMMVAQLITAHNAAMECYRRAMIPEQHAEARRENLAHAGKLSRTFATLLEALNRHRGKGQQKMTVEHVHVHPGGQAVVGMVGTSGGGDRAQNEDRCDARQIADAPQPEMWGSLPDHRTAVPAGGDGEWPLPDARRPIEGWSEG
jgi:hypothetical protein